MEPDPTASTSGPSPERDGLAERDETTETVTLPDAPALVVPSADAEREENPRLLGEALVAERMTTPASIEAALLEQQIGDSRPIGEILVEHGAVAPSDLVEALDKQNEHRRSAADGTLRVDVGLLDSLLQLVDELGRTREQLRSDASRLGDSNLLHTSERLDAITADLHQGVLRARMQPIGAAWKRLPRIVRDLGVRRGRRVRLELRGADTELDTALVAAVKDPLTHLVRDCVSHGFEPPAERIAAGKDAEGLVVLRAFSENGCIAIEVTDDGHGLGAEPEAVRTTVEELGGSIGVSAEPGAGRTVRITLPPAAGGHR